MVWHYKLSLLSALMYSLIIIGFGIYGAEPIAVAIGSIGMLLAVLVYRWGGSTGGG